MAYLFEKHYSYKGDHDEDLDHVPDFKEKIDSLVKNAKTVLVVGWRPDTGYYLFEYLTGFSTVTLVEIFENNCKSFTLNNVNVVCDNILEFIKKTETVFDVLIWQDGPEHVTIPEFEQFLKDCSGKVKNMIIATPNGVYPQDALYGNIYERHNATWFQNTYLEFGFDVREYIADVHWSLNRKNGLIGYKVL